VKKRNQDKLISVIIASYNSELYIEKCIKSVLDNKCDDIEIIVIDDESTDNSLKIINKYKKDITILTKKNSGVSDSRNLGIDVSHGKYILFIDGDDYISTSSLKKIVKYIKHNNFDLLLLNTTKYYEDDNIFEKEILSFKNDTLSMKDLIDYKICARPWRFLYKREILINNNLRFPSGISYEDESWVPMVIYYSKIIKYLDIDYYYYLKRKNSITGLRKFNYMMDLSKIVEIVYEWNKDKKWDNSYVYFSLSRCIKNLLYSTKYYGNKEKEIILDWYNSHKKILFDILRYNKKMYISLKLFGPIKGIKIYKKLFKINNKTKKIKYNN
jgi:glycosyltransferase involved in cell wall biosynthesis